MYFNDAYDSVRRIDLYSIWSETEDTRNLLH